MNTNKRVGLGTVVFLLADILLIASAVIMLIQHRNSNDELTAAAPTSTQTQGTTATEPIVTEPTYPSVSYAQMTSDTKTIGEEISCQYGILVDVEHHTILAERGSTMRIYPASLTKMMTLIVALESDVSMEDTFTFTEEMIAPLVDQSASRAGFLPGETISFRDLLYGAALPSGADATLAIASMVAGNEIAFAEKMNQKAAAIGMQNTHFMNASGLHDVNHYSTLQDLALLVEYGCYNEMFRTLLATYQYTTAATPQNPTGLLLESTMFSRMYGNEVDGLTIQGGKTGFTNEAGNCLASFVQKDGKQYIGVLTMGQSKWRPIFDTFTLYGTYIDYQGTIQTVAPNVVATDEG